MLDLSNNNAADQNFTVAYRKGGQRRVYLKCCQGVDFVDKTFTGLRERAIAAGLKVGAYDFLEPLHATPEAAAEFFLKHLPVLKGGRDLRPCLDVEYGTATAEVGEWVTDVAAAIREATGLQPLIYGSGYFLEACKFKSPIGPLWLAAYGRNDGKEYPVTMVPAPWSSYAAHQYTSEAKVLGITGPVDLSHVFTPSAIDIPRSH